MNNKKNFLMKKTKTRNIVYLNNTLPKSNLNELSSNKKTFQKKEGIISKYNTNFFKENYLNYKTLNDSSIIEDRYLKYIKGINKINNNNNDSYNSSNFLKSKSIKDNNLSLNFYSLLQDNKNSNLDKLRSMNQSDRMRDDIKVENKNQTFKHIIRLKNNVIFKRKTNDYILNNDKSKSKYNSNISNRKNKFTISNISYI